MGIAVVEYIDCIGGIRSKLGLIDRRLEPQLDRGFVVVVVVVGLSNPWLKPKAKLRRRKMRAWDVLCLIRATLGCCETVFSKF